MEDGVLFLVGVLTGLVLFLCLGLFIDQVYVSSDLFEEMRLTEEKYKQCESIGGVAELSTRRGKVLIDDCKL